MPEGSARTFIAPGKLMIAGEYSVLGPAGEALAVAVAPGLEVVVNPASGWELARADGDATWREGEPVPVDLRFVAAALTRVRDHFDIAPQRVVTRVLGDVGVDTRKPGIGGSASATVATVAALLATAGEALSADVVTGLAVQAHLAEQGGRGSGYDVATIAHGGLVRWRPARIAGAFGAQGEALRIRWPDGLYFLAGYTGRSASTTRLIAAMEADVVADRAMAVRELATLAHPVGELIDAFQDGDVPAILAGVDACHAALVAWDRIGAVTDSVAEMIALARSVGARAKVSGAGGGDSVLAFASDPAMLTSVGEAWREAGYTPLSFENSRFGVREKKE